jgi:putative transposase
MALSRPIARQLVLGIRADYADLLPSAFASFEARIAHLRLPVTHRRFIRTTNLLELFVEERRWLKIILNGFCAKPVRKLSLGALIRAGRPLARTARH